MINGSSEAGQPVACRPPRPCRWRSERCGRAERRPGRKSRPVPPRSSRSRTNRRASQQGWSRVTHRHRPPWSRRSGTQRPRALAATCFGRARYRPRWSSTCESGRGRNHRRLHRSGHHHARRVHVEEATNQSDIPRHETRPVTAMFDRFDSEWTLSAVERTVVDGRVEHGDWSSVPAEIQIALVRGHNRAPSASPSDDLLDVATATPVRAGWLASSARPVRPRGPTAVSASAATDCAPANRAPTSYVG